MLQFDGHCQYPIGEWDIIFSVKTQKHCILVCNSPAYQMPSQESINYAGLLPDQLVQKLTEVSVVFVFGIVVFQKEKEEKKADTATRELRR